MVRYGVIAAIVLLVTAGFAPTVSAQSVDGERCVTSTESVETSYADITGTVQQHPNKSSIVRITYQGLSPDDRLEVALPSDVSIIRTVGFSRNTDTASVRYTGGDKAILEYRIGVSSTEVQYANGSDWLFAPAPSHIGDTGVDLEIESNGAIGNEFLYIGNYTEYAVTEGCHEISIVNAAAGNLTENPAQIIQRIGYAARNLEIGHRYEEVTIFLTPGFARPPFPGFARDSDAWVTKSDLLTGDLSYSRMIIHEYIHTRQAFNRGATTEMSWVIEGSADYLSYKLSLETDAISAEQYNAWLQNGSQTDAVLTDQLTWKSRYVEYTRGGAFFAVLDQRMQSTSNGSVEALLYRINSVGGDDSHTIVTRSLFLATVRNASSESTQDWANTTIDSTGEFDISAAKADAEEGSFVDSLAASIKQRTEEKPLWSVANSIMLGVLLTMLIYELRRESNSESEEENK